MKKKIILGILSSDPYNDTDAFLKQMSNNGFVIHSISSKIREISKYLLKQNNMPGITEEIVNSIRKRGYLVNKLFWINIILTSISEKENNIIIDDIWEEDLYEGYIIPIISDPILVPNTNFVKYPDSLSNIEMKRWMKEVEEKLYNIK